ncbi:TPA: hypothetical protein HA278_01855 [Candidatus Woesearchaeota archaeon]|nr:hypothetical protein [archaeon]HIJ10779.1 hypothetical protein [Candidatus Woesearchaeota archaeon]
MTLATFQTFQATVIKKENVTHDVIVLSCSVPTDFSFKAGQFITLMITKDGETKPRSYSILNAPSETGTLSLCIKIVPDGWASDIFNMTKKDDTFLVKGPFGHFVFDESGNDHWFICGGTGVVPFYSMLQEYLIKRDDQFTLVFSVKTKRDLFFHNEFEALASTYENFTYIPTLTREEWDGATGRVQEHLPEDLSGKTFYVCGLKELVLETKELLISKGVSKDMIKVERYS